MTVDPYWYRRLWVAMRERHVWQPRTYGRRFWANQVRRAIDGLRGKEGDE